MILLSVTPMDQFAARYVCFYYCISSKEIRCAGLVRACADLFVRGFVRRPCAGGFVRWPCTVLVQKVVRGAIVAFLIPLLLRPFCQPLASSSQDPRHGRSPHLWPRFPRALGMGRRPLASSSLDPGHGKMTSGLIFAALLWDVFLFPKAWLRSPGLTPLPPPVTVTVMTSP